MTIKLYQIEQSIHDLLSKSELSLEELEQATQLDDKLHSKLDDMLAYHQEQEQTLKAFEQSFKDKLSQIKNEQDKIKGLKRFILDKMEQYQIKELKSKHFLNVKIVGCGCKPVIIDEGFDLQMIPKAFTKTTIEISKTAIKEALEAGEVLDFARFGEQTKTIKIKG